jgi:hypothetical protein
MLRLPTRCPYGAKEIKFDFGCGFEKKFLER